MLSICVVAFSLMQDTTYYNTLQLCRRWSMHQESIRRLIRKSRLPAIRIGKRMRVSSVDVEAFELSHQIIRSKGAMNHG